MSRFIGKLCRHRKREKSDPVKATLFIYGYDDEKLSQIKLVVWHMDARFRLVPNRRFGSQFSICTAVCVELGGSYIHLWGSDTRSNCHMVESRFVSPEYKREWLDAMCAQMTKWARANFWNEYLRTPFVLAFEQESIKSRLLTEEVLLSVGFKRYDFK